MNGRMDQVRFTKGVARYRVPWYLRLWRWLLVKLERRDPHMDSVVFMAHFDAPPLVCPKCRAEMNAVLWHSGLVPCPSCGYLIET